MARTRSIVRIGILLGAAVLFSPISPFLLLAVPFALMLLAFRGRDAFAVAAALFLLALAFGPGGGTRDAGWFVERGWTLMLGGCFTALAALERPRGTFDRALVATAVAGAIAAAMLLLQPVRAEGLDFWMRNRIDAAARTAWTLLQGADASSEGNAIRSAVDAWARFQGRVYPAMLAAAGIPALAVAGHFAVGRDARIGPLREFRFRDGLVWVLVAGLVLLVAPLGAAASRIGENATLFMGLLFLARGGAVLIWTGAAVASSAWTWLLLGVGALLAYPVALGLALALGLADTWLHLRDRLRRAGVGAKPE
jgi:hypothetical protein